MIISIVVSLLSVFGTAGSNQEESLAKAVEQLRSSMIHPTREALADLTSPSLSYGHSNGVIEDQETFIGSLISGKYNFLSIALSEQTMNVQGNIGIVRHDFSAATHDRGKPETTVRLRILLVWQKTGEKWTLIARQAVKI